MTYQPLSITLVKTRLIRSLCPILLCAVTAPELQSEEPAKSPTTTTATDAESVFQQGRAFLSGQGVTKDPKMAFDLMKKAAELDHPEAIGGLGYFYANGVAVEKDEVEAVKWFRAGAEKGGSKAQYNFARMLLDGKGVEHNPATGQEWLRKSADQGLADALFTLGNIYYFGEFGETKDFERAFPLLLQAAEKGYIDAQNMVGVMFSEGLGVERDENVAMQWYRKAAVEGHVKAQSNLGRLLGPTNRRPEKDPNERIEGLTWLMVAAKQGDVMATKVIEDALPSKDEAEFEQARKKAAEIRSNLNSKTATRKLFTPPEVRVTPVAPKPAETTD